MSLVAAAAGVAVGLVLLAAAVGHLRDSRGTLTALTAHGVLPARLRRATVALLPPLELLLGVALLLGVLAGHGRAPFLGAAHPVLPVAAGGAATLLAAFAAYLALVVSRTRGVSDVPCGCGLGAAPVGHWAVLRAVVLVGLALVAALGGAPAWGTLPTDQAPVLAQAFVVAAAGLTLAIATAILPAARAVPPALTTLPPVGGAR